MFLGSHQVKYSVWSCLDLTRSEPKVLWLQTIRKGNITHAGDFWLILYLSWDFTQSILRIAANCWMTADCFQEMKYSFEMLWFTAQPLDVKYSSVIILYLQMWRERASKTNPFILDCWSRIQCVRAIIRKYKQFLMTVWGTQTRKVCWLCSTSFPNC